MSIDQVQNLLVMRVREEAASLGIRPRALMAAVWRAWERMNRPPLLGATETRAVLERLAARGLLELRPTPDGDPSVLWSGLSDEEVARRVAGMDPPLSHDEALFLEGIKRHLLARSRGAWYSWEQGTP